MFINHRSLGDITMVLVYRLIGFPFVKFA